MTDQDSLLLVKLDTELKGLIRSFADERNVQNERWAEIKPLIQARSGEVVEARDMKSDINALGAKVRALDGRVTKIEQRLDRMVWMFLGGVAVIQFLAWFVPYIVQRLVG